MQHEHFTASYKMQIQWVKLRAYTRKKYAQYSTHSCRAHNRAVLLFTWLAAAVKCGARPAHCKLNFVVLRSSCGWNNFLITKSCFILFRCNTFQFIKFQRAQILKLWIKAVLYFVKSNGMAVLCIFKLKSYTPAEPRGRKRVRFTGNVVENSKWKESHTRYNRQKN